MRKLIVGFTCLLGCVGSALAVPYTLPSGSDVNLAQLQTLTDYSTICETDSPCDVPAGDYQLVVFDASWESTVRIVSVGETSSGNDIADRIYQVRESDAGEFIYAITAQCVEGDIAISMTCNVYDDGGGNQIALPSSSNLNSAAGWGGCSIADASFGIPTAGAMDATVVCIARQ